jgi:hypothetical protein
MTKKSIRKRKKIKSENVNPVKDESIIDSQLQEKLNIFYGAIVNGHIESSMERDKSLLTLSGGAIGLLITLMTTVRIKTWYEIVIYLCAFAVFAATIHLLLKVFDLNKGYYQQLAKDEKADDILLRKYDVRIYRLFIFGIFLLFVEGTIVTINQFQSNGDKTMAEEEKKPIRLPASVTGLSNMVPDSQIIKKSIVGLQDMKPVVNNTDTSKKADKK